MQHLWRCPSRLRRSFGVALASIAIAAALACGPDFPNIYYSAPDRELLRGPEAIFAAEMARLVEKRPAIPQAVRLPWGLPRARTIEIDIADATRALREHGVYDRSIEWEYERVRRELETWIEHSADEAVTTAKSPLPSVTLPAQVPLEFQYYLQGALAWHQGQLTAARSAWLRLLDLPPAERRYRTTWAAFMLGRIDVEAVRRSDRFDSAAVAAAYGAARERLRTVRLLAADGWPDSLGLAAASLGWEARAALSARDEATAISLYLQQYVTGDDSALASLRFAAAEILDDGRERLGPLARSPELRRVITAYLISHFSCYDPERAEARTKAWIAALETADVRNEPELDRLAWFAYDAGFFALAERWASLAPAAGGEINWIRAKLALRHGDLEKGERLLRAALSPATLGFEHRKQALAELGRICLARDNYAGALEADLQGEHWADAAFVAERVMSLAELQAFVDALPPPARSPAAGSFAWGAPLEQRLRHLLARRLARAGQSDLAARYFPAEWQEKFRAYTDNIRHGFDIARSDTERGRAFWQAALLAQKDGMELLGTELEPDWALWSGSYSFGSSAADRLQLTRTGDLFSPTPMEVHRLETHVTPAQRYHYYYRAAELAGWAAALLPNDSDETAQILAAAGGWLKARDPQAAKPFYQALVIRCGKTALGQAAAKIRWFPEPASAATPPDESVAPPTSPASPVPATGTEL